MGPKHFGVTTLTFQGHVTSRGGLTSHGHMEVPRDQCALTSVPGYIVYSACGSFWVPMLGMIVFYWKIYKTAVAATDAVNRGFVEQKTTGFFTDPFSLYLAKI